MCEKSAEMRRLGKEVIREQESLRWIRETGTRIGYALSDLAKKRAGEQLVFGECKKVPAWCQAWMPYDFVIVFYQPHSDLLTEEGRKRLMRHELMHVGLKSSGELFLRPHDVEDFDPLIEDYGLHWAEDDMIGGGKDGEKP